MTRHIHVSTEKNLTKDLETLLKNNLTKEWGLIENKIQNWSCTMAQANYILMEQAIHNTARESLEIIKRKEKKPKHIVGNKKLEQLIKARRIAIKQKNRIIHALINKQSLKINFKLPPITNKYCQSIPIYPSNIGEMQQEEQP